MSKQRLHSARKSFSHRCEIARAKTTTISLKADKLVCIAIRETVVAVKSRGRKQQQFQLTQKKTRMTFNIFEMSNLKIVERIHSSSSSIFFLVDSYV